MTEERTIWGVHQEWDEDSLSGMKPSTIAVGWPAIGDLNVLAKTRDAFKAAFSAVYPDDKPGAVPVKAGVLFRFANQMRVGDVVVYPSKADRLVNIGIVAGDYQFQPKVDAEYPHRRRVDWRVQTQRAKYSQAALYEIGSAVTLFQVTNNADEFLAALEGKAFEAAEVDAVSEQAVATQVEENVEDFVIKRILSSISHEQFEHLVADLLRCMGYHARVTRYASDGGVDVVAHKDELGFEPPIIKVQCKHTLSTIGGPDVQKLLGAAQPGESALFVTVGEYSQDARHIERNNSRLRLIGRSELLALIFTHYERLDARFKAALPLKRGYSPSLSTE
jgi:restriction system protein